MKNLLLILFIVILIGCRVSDKSLEKSFEIPRDEYKPWTYWFWINGNMTRDGITKDLESMKRVGINGVLWMEVSGPFWAPKGKVEAGTKQWDEMMQWAIAEANRLNMQFDMTVDFGYGCGGPHITPNNSMKELVWSDTMVEGGKQLTVNISKPLIDIQMLLHPIEATDTPDPKQYKIPWLRPGETLPEKVVQDIKEIDSYHDIAVFAIKAVNDTVMRLSKDQLSNFDGRGTVKVQPVIKELLQLNAVPQNNIIDLTNLMAKDGTLNWDAPNGKWQIIRMGYASNFQMTRPTPGTAIGLECDRLNPQGIEAHFNAHLKPILEAAGNKTGKTLQYIHVDSWEAHGQNWTDGFEEEFRKNRGYDIKPWLPALTGVVVQNAEQTSRFLWDMRLTVSELMLENYIDKLKELIAPYGVAFSSEPYGNFGVDNLTYGGRAELPIAEFWTPGTYDMVRDNEDKEALKQFIEPIIVKAGDNNTLKSMASIANTYGRKRLGAEAFTGSRAWGNHPWLIKGLGDHAFAQGVNHYIFHLFAHQAYDDMVPGLTHRRWGLNLQRHQTWWEFSKPYFDYVARCQTLLQQGSRVADIAILPDEGSPVRINHTTFTCPPGYDFDVCSSEIIQQMQFKNGRIHLPSGVSYRYLLLPNSGRLRYKTAQKVETLRKAGASIFQSVPIIGTPGLEGYPKMDVAVREMAKNWPVLSKKGLVNILVKDNLSPDFTGDDLNWLHRKSNNDDIYFVANPDYKPIKRTCKFRAKGRFAELWNPETGEIFALTNVKTEGDLSVVNLSFDAAQSWFVVFKDKPSGLSTSKNPFPNWETIMKIDGNWDLSFNPEWGSNKTYITDTLYSWTEHADSLVKYYSGTGTYQINFNMPESVLKTGNNLYLNLGEVAVMARVVLNGKDCGSLWKPPYRINISEAIQPGKNELVVSVANTWANRLIGDEQLPLDSNWQDWEVLTEWPKWFTGEQMRPKGHYTFTSTRHYTKDCPLPPSGLLGPVCLEICK